MCVVETFCRQKLRLYEVKVQFVLGVPLLQLMLEKKLHNFND